MKSAADTFDNDGFFQEENVSPGPSLIVPFDDNRDGLVISHHVKDNDRGKPIVGTFVEFVNCGQTVVWIDNAVPIMPGGYYTRKNPCYNVRWQFGALASAPSAKSFYIQAGNNLKILIHKTKDAFADLKQGLADIAAGDISVAITPATPINDNPIGELTLDTSIAVPAGKKRVVVINKGDTMPVGGVYGANASASAVCGSLSTEIPVDPLGDGFMLEASGLNPVTNIFGTLPSVTITNTAGAAIWWYAV